jgi:hypothetical protein
MTTLGGTVAGKYKGKKAMAHILHFKGLRQKLGAFAGRGKLRASLELDAGGETVFHQAQQALLAHTLQAYRFGFLFLQGIEQAVPVGQLPSPDPMPKLHLDESVELKKYLSIICIVHIMYNSLFSCFNRRSRP